MADGTGCRGENFKEEERILKAQLGLPCSRSAYTNLAWGIAGKSCQLSLPIQLCPGPSTYH